MSATPHARHEGRFRSAALGRDMGFTVYLPAGYGKGAGGPYPVLHLLHGGSSHHAEWGQAMDLGALLAGYPMVVFMPEGEHSLYLNGHDGARFEDYVVTDVPGFVEASFRVRTDRAGRALAGLSMGGFGSLNLGLKHPERYAALGSMSGAFGMTWWSLGLRPGSPYLPALGPPGSPEREAYNPWRILEGALARDGPRELPALWLAVGLGDDPDVVEVNRAYHRSLLEAGVPHAYVESPGGHTWDYWRSATPGLLAFVARHLCGPPR